MSLTSLKYLLWTGLCTVGLGHSFQFFDIFEGFKWCLFIIFATVTAVGTVLTAREFKVPQLPKGVWIGFALFTLNWIVLDVVYNTPFFDNHILQRLGFLTLAFCAIQYSYYKKEGVEALLVPCLVVNLVSAAYGFYQFHPYLFQLIFDNYYYSTVGNVNQFAQLLALNLILLFNLSPKISNKHLRYFSYFLEIMCITMVGLLSCRSIYLALTISSIYLFFRFNRQEKKILAAKLAIGFVLFAVLFSFKSKTYYDFNGSSKQSTMFTRLEIYKETLDLILDNPLGIGPDRFEFGYIPYQIAGEFPAEETSVFREPHNEYLRYMAEDGIPATLLMYGLYAYLLLILYRKRNEVKNYNIYAGFAVLWIVESIFQFPSNVPYSFTLSAVVLGFFLSELYPSRELPKYAIRVPLAGLCVLLGILSYNFTYAKKMEDPRIANIQQGAYEKKDKACHAFPGVWRNCQVYFQLLDQQMFVDIAQKEIFEKLEYQPYFYPGLFYWAKIHSTLNNIVEACYAAKVYNEIFSKQVKPNLLAQFYNLNCAQYGNAFNGSKLYPIYNNDTSYQYMIEKNGIK